MRLRPFWQQWSIDTRTTTYGWSTTSTISVRSRCTSVSVFGFDGLSHLVPGAFTQYTGRSTLDGSCDAAYVESTSNSP